jgi:uncharacterized DUF497 family protein
MAESKSAARAGTLVTYDSENSAHDDDRFISLGISSRSNVLLVVHCEREGSEFRIVSARKAERHEVKKWQRETK